MKLCLGFVWCRLKGYATNLTQNGGLEMYLFFQNDLFPGQEKISQDVGNAENV